MGADQTPVVESSTTTRDDATANLAIRLHKFESTIRNQVGFARYDALSQMQRVALIDFAYNYGSLTPTLARLVALGSTADLIVGELTARAFDNQGENATRRKTEAALWAMGD